VQADGEEAGNDTVTVRLMDGSQKVRDPRVLLKTHLSETSVQKTERRAEQ
jgi:hypothetical protein